MRSLYAHPGHPNYSLLGFRVFLKFNFFLLFFRSRACGADYYAEAFVAIATIAAPIAVQKLTFGVWVAS